MHGRAWDRLYVGVSTEIKSENIYNENTEQCQRNARELLVNVGHNAVCIVHSASSSILLNEMKLATPIYNVPQVYFRQPLYPRKIGLGTIEALWRNDDLWTLHNYHQLSKVVM